MNYAAVLTGDIKASTELKEEERAQLLQVLQQSLSEVEMVLPDWTGSVFQGDSFQGFTTKHIPNALEAALFLWCSLKLQNFDSSIAIGLGDITLSTGSSLTSDGTSFRNSGRHLSNLKTDGLLLGAKAGSPQFDAEWQVHSCSVTFILERTTVQQAEAMLEMLKGHTQSEAAVHLQVRQPAITQRLKAAGWGVLKTMSDHFGRQVQSLPLP